MPDVLPASDALSAQDRLEAAFRSGELDAAGFLEGMAGFAAHPDPEVVLGSTRLIGFIHDQFPELRRSLARHVSRTYGRRYRAARGADTVDGDGLAPPLGALLAVEGRDQEARNYLVRQGSLYLELDGEDAARRATVPTHVLSSAFVEVMKARPALAFDPLLALSASGSPLERDAALRGLAATPDAEQADRLLALAAAPDSPLTKQQSLSLVSDLMANSAQTDRVWAWMQEGFDGFAAGMVPEERRGELPELASVFCSAERRDEVEAFFVDKAALVPDHDRSLARTLERIEQCAALKDRQGDSLRAALGG
ncbi:MAG: ERAP1-like C-terminal domain-containing protein [Litorimonas sp.]